MQATTIDRRERVDLSDVQLSELLSFACELADRAGAVILPHFRETLSVDNKLAHVGAYDPVTIADRDAETAIRELITGRYPTHGILGEEHGYARGESALTWVLDPIDGTRAFISGFPVWGTLVSLHDGERAVLGVIDQPYTRERFIGSRLGAELRTDRRKRALSTRSCARLEDAVFSCTAPEMFAPGFERAAFERVWERAKLTRFGFDCYAYGMLAHGFVDVVVEAGLGTYDIQSHIPIIEAAGGVVTSWDGGDPQDGGRVVAAGDARVHEQVLGLLG